MRKLNRREFVKAAGTSTALLLTPEGRLVPRALGANARRTLPAMQNRFDPRQPANFITPLRVPSSDGLLGVYEPAANFALTAKVVDEEVLPGQTAKLWVYEVEQAGRRYRNPTVKLNTRAGFSTTFQNQLGEPSIIHWHGFHVSGKNDGHPADAVSSGAAYAYDLPVLNRAATYWYHPHPDGNTARQVYFGLAGLFIVDDDDDSRLRTALDLNLGETDIPLVLQDRKFTGSGAVLYNPALSEYFMGFLGDTILVNFTANPFMDVSTRVYRFRLLNGSNARSFRLALLNGSTRLPFYIIGNDGGLLDVPYSATEVWLSPAERVDVLLDLRQLQASDVVFLKSLPAPITTMPMGDMGGHSQHGQPGGLGQDEEFYVLKLNVKNKVTYDKPTPTMLSEITPINTSGARTRSFSLTGFRAGWYINGQQFSMTRVPVQVSRSTVEIWEIVNDRISMPHPMHVHGFLFQVLERINSPMIVRNLAVDGKGRLPTDKGWKDTVLVWPDERVRIAIDFSHPFLGDQLYLLHCHILEHEDNGMMINYKVV
jgi:suppressor of ftsI/bilirubin oxidase